MAGLAGKSTKLIIRRYLELPQAVALVECAPGKISVLTDANGGSLPKYCNALSKGEERFSLELCGQDYNPNNATFIGFNESFPDNATISMYLGSHGFSDVESKAVIDSYDLHNVNYMLCTQLPATAKRQLQLLVALRSKPQLLILNDPFLPFNGRWRENFSKLLLEYVQDNPCICVVLNLSFTPQFWIGKNIIVSTELGKLAERALQKTQELMLRQEAEKAKTSKSPVQAVTNSQNTEDLIAAAEKMVREPIKEGEDPEALPNIAWYAFRETKDFIFAPLARITAFFRSLGGAAVIGMSAFLVLVMGFTMLPQLAEQRALLHELAGKINVSWSDVKESLQKKEELNSEKVEDAPTEVALNEPSESVTETKTETSAGGGEVAEATPEENTQEKISNVQVSAEEPEVVQLEPVVEAQAPIVADGEGGPEIFCSINPELAASQDMSLEQLLETIYAEDATLYAFNSEPAVE